MLLVQINPALSQEIDSLKTSIRIGAHLSENFLLNSIGNPSGPGHFPICMEKAACLWQ